MIPTGAADPELAFTVKVQPTLTYKLEFAPVAPETEVRVRGMTDSAEALKQAVYLILSTERYKYPIYSRRYGTERAELIGQDRDYVISKLRTLLTEALTQDDRILSVEDWHFEEGRDSVTARFTVKTVYGDLEAEKEVAV